MAEVVEQKTAAQSEQVKVIDTRWTKPLTKAGWTALPNIFLDKQAALKLAPLDINIIMQIAKHWWQAGSAPFPAIATIATSIGVTTRTVQRRITRMVKMGLMERTGRFYARGGQKSNEYTFNGLIEKCVPFAAEVLADRERRKVEKMARLRRREPALTVVK